MKKKNKKNQPKLLLSFERLKRLTLKLLDQSKLRVQNLINNWFIRTSYVLHISMNAQLTHEPVVI